MSNEKFKVKFGLAVGDTKATVDGTTGDINTDGSITALQNLDIRGTTTLGNAAGDTVTINGDTLVNNALTIGSSSGDTLTVNSQVAGNITFTDNSTTTNRGIYGTVGANDYWKYGGGAVGSDQGYAEIATGDNGTEPIYARQYNGGSISKEVKILDGSGNTALAGNLTLGGNGYIYSTTDLALELTGNAARVAGDLTVSGGDLITGNATSTLFNTTTTTLNIGGAATTVSIGANTGTTTINNSLVADDISIATVDTTNLEVTNIKAKDGTAAAVIADSTGIITVSTQLNVDNINISGNTISSTDTNGNITLAPNGTGDTAFTFNNGGNLTNTRNYVLGTIRNSTTDSIGDIWALNSTGPANPFRGISLDNSADTTKGPGTVLRSFSGGAVANAGLRGRVIFEKARGTSASPTAIQAGDLIGSVDATGYTSTGWVNDNIAAVIPAFVSFGASENWVSNTNLGTAFQLQMAPQATTITSATNLVNVIAAQPEVVVVKGDRVALAQAKTIAFNATGCSTSGSTLTIGTLVSGTIATGQVIQLTTGSPINGMYIVANISGSGSGSTWTISGTPGTLTGLTVNAYNGFLAGTNAGTTVDALQNLRLIKNNIVSSNGTSQIVTSVSGTTLDLRGDTVTIENAANTTAYGTFTSTGTTISGAGLSTVTRTTAVETPGTAMSRPSMNIQLTRSDQAAANDGDNTSFRTRVAGSNGTFYTISDIGSVYKTGGDNEFRVNLANGDQTTGSFSGLSILSCKISETRIKAGTPSGTPGASVVNDIAIFDPNKITAVVPIKFPTYTAAQANAITGAVGWQISISDSASGSNPNGMMAFWDTTNVRWSYIHDNSAV